LDGPRTVVVDEGNEIRGGVVRKVYRLSGERVAVREGSTVDAAVGDHLGSVTVLAQGGSVAGATRYLPYGTIRFEGGVWPTDRRFTGQRWEGALGLYDYNARFYDPALGRFLQPDPVVPEPGNPQALHRYAYVYNNPLRYTDPSGHFAWFVAVPVGALIGAGITYGFQVAANISQNGLNVQAFTEVNWAAVGGGAVAGAVGAATFGVGTAVLGAGLAGTVAAGAISGAAAGQAARATENVLSGQAVTAGLGNPHDLLHDAAIGAILSGISYGVAKAWHHSSSTLLAQHYGTDLPPQIRTAFQGWTAERVTFREGTCLYRIHSGRPYGSWWMLEPPAGELQFRIDYAVRPEWNAATEMAILTVPRGESLSGWIGRAAYQGGIYIGGGVQVYLLKVPKGWVSSGPVPW
jgi:RHS repeat-associated protein